MASLFKAESPAFILHRRDYRESSRILSCFTRDYGRVDMICKGCRKSGKARKVLEPFRLYNLSWVGKTDLKTLVHADEIRVLNIQKHANQLYSGLYLNELLNGLIRVAEAEPAIFDLYESTLENLVKDAGLPIQHVLRYFELNMLSYMGYGVSLAVEQDGITPIHQDIHYGFQPEHGFFKTTDKEKFMARGDSIIALNTGHLESVRHEREARNLTRLLISYYLPNTTIQSRKFFI